MRARRLAAAAAAALIAACSAAGEVSAAPARAPSIDAPAGILVDARTGDAIAERDAGARRPIASATKLMTALLVLERAELGDTFTAPGYEASPVESKIDLEEGERMTVRDLLTALLLESANDAAVTIAEGVSGSESRFVQAMNRRARELGLEDTHYANPIGFDDPRNYSSARDLGTLATHLLRDPTFARIVDRPRAELESGSRRRVVENRNRLIAERPEVDGVKTGHTAGAGYVLVGAATDRDAGVVSVVLGAPSERRRDSATRALLEFGMDQFRRRAVLRAGREVATARVPHQDDRVATLTTSEDVAIIVRRGAEAPTTRVDAPAELDGPTPANGRVGTVEVLYGGDVVERVPLVTARAIPAPDAVDRARSAVEAPLTWVVAFAIVLVVAAALIRFRSGSRRRPGARSA